MKKILFFIIALVFAVCSVSCSSEPEETIPAIQIQKPEETIPSIQTQEPAETIPSTQTQEPAETIPSIQTQEPAETIPPIQTQEPDKIVLSCFNADKYLAVEVTFSEFDFSLTNNIIYQGQYYITCNATILVKPRADYKFENASVELYIEKNSGWTFANEEQNTFFVTWSKTIDLDKNGYGKATAFMSCYSSKFEYVHPATKLWQPKFTSASGTITIN